MLDGWPKRKVRHKLMNLAADGAAWSQMAAELRGFLSDAHHYNTALDVHNVASHPPSVTKRISRFSAC